MEIMEAAMGTYASLELHPYSGHGVVKLSAAPATRGSPQVSVDDLPEDGLDVPLGKIMTQKWANVTDMLGMLHMKRGLRFQVHASLLKGIGGPGVDVGAPMVNVGYMAWMALTDIENVVVGSFQIAYDAYKKYKKKEFGHESATGPFVLWYADDEVTNVCVDIKFKGCDIRTRFIEYDGDMSVAVCPVSAD